LGQVLRTFRKVDSAKVDSAIESWRDSTVVICGIPLPFVIFELAVASQIGLEIAFLVVFSCYGDGSLDCPSPLPCPPPRGEVEARVWAFPPEFLKEPVSGEVFDNLELCRERLQGFAFTEGFAIVQKNGSMKQAHPRFSISIVSTQISFHKVRHDGSIC
jgi:hypothetical protein